LKAENRAKNFWITGTLLLAPLLVVCVLFVDVPVAVFVDRCLYGNAKWSSLTSDLPDLLLLVVLLATCCGVSFYLFRSKKGIYDAMTEFAKLVSWGAPLSYLMKVTLKFVFGRINTRTWLRDPEQYGFHWFQGGSGFEGFPSGHMLVMVTLFAALARCYPKTRVLSTTVSVLLGVALVATNYHFVSDVILGAYLGLLTEAVLFHVLLDERGRVGFQAF
jgi:membrane-associated phospholipid phosphatase